MPRFVSVHNAGHWTNLANQLQRTVWYIPPPPPPNNPSAHTPLFLFSLRRRHMTVQHHTYQATIDTMLAV